MNEIKINIIKRIEIKLSIFENRKNILIKVKY